MEDVTSEELNTRQLWIMIKKYGVDTELRDQLIVAYMDRVERIALRYSGLGVEDEDLIQSAHVALIEAIDCCIVEEKTNNSSFIAKYIDSCVRKNFIDEQSYSSDKYGFSLLYIRVLETQKELREKLGREPSVEEIASRFGVVETMIRNILKDIATVENVGLEDMWGDVTKCCGSISDPEFEFFHKMEIEGIDERLEKSPFGPSERVLIEHILSGINEPMDLARLMGISNQRVHLLMHHIREKLNWVRMRFIGPESNIFIDRKYECVEEEKVLKHKMLRDRQNNKNRY